MKTDRRDAEKLARCLRAGDLTAVWVPDAAHEALRDLVRARLAAKQDQTRARARVKLFLLRHGLRAPEGKGAWTDRYWGWLMTVKFEYRALQVTFDDYVAEAHHAAERIRRLEKAIDEAIAAAPPHLQVLVRELQALRGVAKIAAATIATEVGDLTRFATAPELMSYAGIVPREHSSGSTTLRGGVTKTGNTHLRRIIVEAAWSYRHRPAVGKKLGARHRLASRPVVEIAWKAQHRLHARYCSLLAVGKHKNKVVMAVARELLGFVWAIGQYAQHEVTTPSAA